MLLHLKGQVSATWTHVYWRIFVKIFVSAASYTNSVWFDFSRLAAVTKFCCRDRFSQKFSGTHEAICHCNVSPQHSAASSRVTCAQGEICCHTFCCNLSPPVCTNLLQEVKSNGNSKTVTPNSSRGRQQEMVIHKSPQKHFEYVIAYGRSSHMEVWLFHLWRHLSLGSSAVPLFVISGLYSLNCSLYPGKNPWIGLLHFSWLPSVGHVTN